MGPNSFRVLFRWMAVLIGLYLLSWMLGFQSLASVLEWATKIVLTVLVIVWVLPLALGIPDKQDPPQP